MLCNFLSPFQATTDNVHPPDLPSAKGSITALSVGSYVDNSALSISKDSLEEGKLLFIHNSYLVYFQFKGG